MRSILSTIKVPVYGISLFLSLSCVASADTSHAKADQSADTIGGQAGLLTPFERRTLAAESLGGMRVGGQAGLQTPFERRTLAAEPSGGVRVGSQAGQESDPEKPDSEAK
ncbi:MAG TPA: hypothetical protein VEI50_12715 [Nitrospiraceae bacterium]|nr:hypothetical protein [Nitrospiraceae bacterium]